MLAFILLIPMTVSALGFSGPSAPIGTVTGGAGLVNRRMVSSSDTFGSVGYGWMIGFGICDMEEYTGSATDDSALLAWIEEYSKKYYVNIVGNFYFDSGMGDTPSVFPGYGNNLGNDPSGFLNAVKNDTVPDFAEKTPTGRLYIKPEYTAEIVTILKDANPALADQWAKTRLSGKHPIVITVEAVGIFADKDDILYGITVNNYGQMLGVDVSSVNLPAHVTSPRAVLTRNGGTRESLTGTLLADACIADAGRVQSDTYLSTKILKGMFGINSATGMVYTGDAGGYHGRADAVAQGVGDNITGCWIVSINGGDPYTDKYLLSGAYQWDLNSGAIPLNNRGYMEDGTAVVAKGESVTQPFDLGHIKLDNSYYDMWDAYVKRYGVSSVDVTFNVYGTGTGNGIKEYTADRATILGSSARSSESVVSSICGTYTKTGLPIGTFLDWLKDGGLGKIKLDGMNDGDKIKSTLNASQVNGTVAVAFATELIVEVDGEVVVFSNDQVHYAIYTFQDVDRTYRLETKDIVGWSQLKTNNIGQAQFEATTGTPTTEDMFISMGGYEYVANVQYRYVVDDYYRKYQLKAEPYDNYMYYYAGESGSNSGVDGHVSQLGATFTTLEGTPPYGTDESKNLAWNANAASLKNAQWSTYKRDALAFKNKVESILTDIDENATMGEGVYSTDDYAVIVKGNTLTITDNWEIDGITAAVAGGDANMKEATIAGLTALSDKLNLMKTWYDKGEAEFGYRRPDQLNETLHMDLTITLMSLYPDKKDFDSDATGSVIVGFKWNSDSTNPPELDVKTFCKTGDHYYTGNKTAHTCGTTATGSTEVECPGPTCSLAGTAEHYTNNACSAHPTDCPGCLHASTCTLTDHTDCTTDHEDCPGEDYTGHSGFSCTHRGQEGLEYRGNPDGHVWSANQTEHNTSNTVNHGYTWDWTWDVNVNYNAGGYSIAHDKSTRGKQLSEFSEFCQVYKDVKYMDIVDCHVWRLAGGAVKYNGGLADLITPVNLYDPVIELACASKGFMLYNVTDPPSEDAPSYWDTSFEGDMGEGKTVDGAWRSTEDIYIGDAADKDTADFKTSPKYNLQSIGRLANSYNSGSKNTEAPLGIETGARIGDAEHGLLLATSDDTIVWVYDIEEQGGRSHHSFDGFLKQALALATYKEADPISAYRNYIQVQSDFVSLGDNYDLTLCGFHWASEEWKIEEPGDTDAAYGLTQAIFSTQRDDSSYISNFVKESGEFWEKAEALKDTNVNTRGLNNQNILATEMPGRYSTANDAPSSKIKPIIQYAEGGGAGNADGKGAKGLVRLEQFDVYRTWDKETINKGVIETVHAKNANFYTEGKQGPDTSAEVFFPKIGYVDKKDSVEIDEHLYDLSYSATNYVGGQTLVTDGQGGLNFESYGILAPYSALKQDAGHRGVTNVKVTGGSEHNVVRNSSTLFPFIKGLNVIRWKPNGSYGGYPTSLVYAECIHFAEIYPGVVSTENTMLTNYPNNNFTGMAEKNILQDLLPSDYVLDDGTSDITSGSGFIVDAGYSRDNKTNAVTIFNPSSAEHTKIIEVSDMLPDGTNRYKDSTNINDGYVVRDQRVNTSIVVEDGIENYVSCEPLTTEDVNSTQTHIDIKLKDKTTYNGGVTEYYTVNDFEQDAISFNYTSISKDSGELEISESGDYTISLTKATDDSTTVKLNLDKGDKLYTDGTSAYLKRNTVVPSVTYDSLVKAATSYYEKLDKDISTVEAAKALEQASNVIASTEPYVEEFLLNVSYLDGITAVDNTAVYYIDKATEAFNKICGIIKSKYSAPEGNVIVHYVDAEIVLFDYLRLLSGYRDTLTSLCQIDPSLQFDSLAETPTVTLDSRSTLVSEFQKENYISINKGTTLSLNLRGIDLDAGDIVKFTLTLDANYNKPVDFVLSTNGTVDTNYTLVEQHVGNKLTWLIEAKSDLEIGKLDLVFNRDVTIPKFEGNIVTYEDIWLLDVGTITQDKVFPGTTLEHNWSTSSDIYHTNANRMESINKYLFTCDLMWRYASTDIPRSSGNLYVVKDNPAAMSIKSEALSNPHKVYNANWRHYVVGWYTDDGVMITSPNDAALFNDSTVLCWPAAISGTITVRELKNSACLVKYRDNVYLTTNDLGEEHYIAELGISVTSYDFWTLGSTYADLQELKIDSAVELTYPLQPEVKAKDDSSHELAYQSYMYEFFFALRDYDAPLFNVEYSRNLEYRFKSDDTVNRDFDYDITETTTTSNLIVIAGLPASGKSSKYISLDDEFSVYFDNVGVFEGNPDWKNANVPGDKSALGYGWNANGISKLNGDTDVDGISEWYGKYASTVEAEAVDPDDENVIRKTTETTAWIYAKYLTFNTDVYAFKESSESAVNPTLGAYNKDGTPNIPVLYKAGTPVYLGTYLGGDYSLDTCNTGGFVDFGSPNNTKDKYERPWVYTFWLPISAGECKDQLVVKFHTVNINDSSLGSNNSGASSLTNYYTTVAATEPTNNDSSTVNDNGYVVRDYKTSVVGRIGALTISDTGDPRYSDSFKTADIANDDLANFLIYPVVRKIKEYSNKFENGGNPYISKEGSQRGIVLDPFDVRGRIAADFLIEHVENKYKDIGGNAWTWENGYKRYNIPSYNTYGTQWFKEKLYGQLPDIEHKTDEYKYQLADSLPLSPSFNKHDTFKLEPLKVGYEVYLSLESIGNYFSCATHGGALDDPDAPSVVNGNNDYGDEKVQVRPFYSAVDAVRADGKEYSGPVDVYMRRGDTYVMVNSGCDKSFSSDENTACTVPSHSITQMLDVISNNLFPYYIETNTGEEVKVNSILARYELDENMQRRMVTDAESKVTANVISKTNSRSLLKRIDNSTDGVGGKELDIYYSYGNSQLMFLRERNMTYVGGSTVALSRPEVSDESLHDTKSHAQKYYFGLSLPSSSVFVPHGEELTMATVLKTGYVVSSVDIVAVGDVWSLHYMSPVSKMSLNIKDKEVHWTKWNPFYLKYPWLVPVTYYDIETTSLSDVDTEGSH